MTCNTANGRSILHPNSRIWSVRILGSAVLAQTKTTEKTNHDFSNTITMPGVAWTRNSPTPPSFETCPAKGTAQPPRNKCVNMKHAA